MTVRVNHAGYNLMAAGMKNMSVADVRRDCRGRLGIPRRAVAFMNEQEVYLWRKYQGVKTQVYPAR